MAIALEDGNSLACLTFKEVDDYYEDGEHWHFVSLRLVLNQDDRSLDLLIS